MFVLRDVEGLSTEETADALDLSIPAVKSRLASGTVAIARALEQVLQKSYWWRWQTVTCSDFLKELTDYLDDSMDAQTTAELEDHLQWCHNCYVVCNTTKMTIEIYRDSHLYELPDDLRGRLRSAIMTKCECIGQLHEALADQTRPGISGLIRDQVI